MVLFIATGNIPCVYLQNSGFGNIINPLLSLVDENVYNIPLLILMGWRGEPYKKDELQHKAQGEKTEQLLKTLDINYSILSDNIDYAKKMIDEAVHYNNTTNKPYVLLVKRQTFEKYLPINSDLKNINPKKLNRYEVLETISSRIVNEVSSL